MMNCIPEVSSERIERVLILGWDGADWQLLQPMLEAGRLPVIAQLMEEGVHGPLGSTRPTHSFTAWASFLTGKNPGKHGIYAFHAYDQTQPGVHLALDRGSITGETFIETLSRHGRCVGTAHVPLTYPPAPVHGFWISGMIVPSGAVYTHPPELQADLEGLLGQNMDEDIAWNWLEDEWDTLFEVANDAVRGNAQILERVMGAYDWDMLSYIFVSPDRLQHAVMRLVDETHPHYDEDLAARYRSRYFEHFALLDQVLGEAMARIDGKTLLLVMSDHGFRPSWLSFSAYAWVREHGWLQMHRDWRALRRALRGPLSSLIRSASRRQQMTHQGARLFRDRIDWGRTKAYVASVSEQGIRINLQGREPFGSVPPSEYEAVRRQLRDELTEARDPDSGQALLAGVYLRESVYEGKRLEQAPDIVFDFAPGVTAPVNSLGHTVVEPSGWKSGDHGMQGILVAYGPGVRQGARIAGARLIDVAPTVLHTLGVPVPRDVDGLFLEDLFEESIFGPVQFSRPQVSKQDGTIYTAEEQEGMEDRLRSLGYL
jgi:predicted AlkP superfamily phosphohydrolase/phosphomutase